MRIRPGHAADLEAINAIHGHYAATTHVSFDTRALNASERAAWFARFRQERMYRLFVADEDGEVVGYAHSLPWRSKPAYERTVESTVLLRPGSEGRGIGRELYGRLLDEIREAGAHRAYAIIALPNDGSIAFHERLGFRAVGVLDEAGRKFDRWWSTLLMERRFS
jgi:phosphinothricin acetyltransferase